MTPTPKQYIWEYTLEEIEQELERGPLIITDGNPQKVFILRKGSFGYACEFYRGPQEIRNHKGTQLGATLAELLLRRVFGVGNKQVVIEGTPPHQQKQIEGGGEA